MWVDHCYRHHPVLNILGIVGFGVCLDRILSGDLKLTPKVNFLIKILASALIFLYAPLLSISLLSKFAPESLNSLLLNFWSIFASYFDNDALKELVPTLISENVKLFNETMGLFSVFFYGSTLAILIFAIMIAGLVVGILFVIKLLNLMVLLLKMVIIVRLR